MPSAGPYTSRVKRAIFLDRDNTIIQNDGDLGNPDEVRLIRGAAHAIGSLRQLGYRIIVVSNQGGVARGTYTERDVDAVHERIAQMVHDSAGAIIDRFYYCPFHPDGTVEEYAKEHPWRKPQPGMLLEAARSLDLDLRECWMVGDQERDIEAGRAAGCQTILISRKTSVTTRASFQAASLAEAAAIIAQNRVRTRQVIPPAPTVVVSPRAVPEEQPVAAGSGRRSEAAGAEAVERVIAEPSPAGESDGNEAAEVEAPDRPVHPEVGHEEAVAEADAAISTTNERDAEVSPEAQPLESRRDPFRHIPLRVRGVERSAGDRHNEAAPLDRQLTELLGEVRSWRHSQREFTPAMMMGSLASLATLILAVLLAVYLEPAAAMVWICVTIVAQLGVTAFIVLNLRR